MPGLLSHSIDYKLLMDITYRRTGNEYTAYSFNNNLGIDLEVSDENRIITPTVYYTVLAYFTEGTSPGDLSQLRNYIREQFVNRPVYEYSGASQKKDTRAIHFFVPSTENQAQQKFASYTLQVLQGIVRDIKQLDNNLDIKNPQKVFSVPYITKYLDAYDLTVHQPISRITGIRWAHIEAFEYFKETPPYPVNEAYIV